MKFGEHTFVECVCVSVYMYVCVCMPMYVLKQRALQESLTGSSQMKFGAHIFVECVCLYCICIYVCMYV